MNIKERLAELRAKRENIEKRKAEIRDILTKDDKADMDALQKELDGMEARMKDIASEEAGLEKRQKILGELSRGQAPQGVHQMDKPEGKMDKRNRYDTAEYRQAFMDYVCRNKPIPVEYRDNAVTATTDIGALVPPTTLNKIIEKLTSYGMILPLVTKTNYRTGMNIPTSTVKPTATWVSEGQGSDKQKKTTGSITFSHNKLRCAVAVTLETDYMAYSAFETALVNNMVEAMAVAMEEAIIKGTGVNQPTGIIHDLTAGQSFKVSKISYKTLTDAEGALPLAYESGAVWVMSKKTFMEFIAMTDSAGQPIARVNYGIAGNPERTLLGRRVVLTDYLPSFSTSLTTDDVFAFLYRMKDYVLNTNFNIGIKTYEDNETDDIVRKSITVCDGKPVDTNSLIMLTGAGKPATTEG